MSGQIRLNDLILDNDRNFFMQELTLTSYTDQEHNLLLQSDIINGSLKGIYTFASLAKSCKQLAFKYFPILGKNEKNTNYNLGNDIRFKFEIANTEELANALNFDWSTPETTTIDGAYNDKREEFGITVKVPTIKNGTKGLYKDIQFAFTNQHKQLNCNLSEKVITRKNDTISCYGDIFGRNDSITTHLQWNNVRTELTHAGEIIFHTQFTEHDSTTNANTQILPTQIVLQN